jgi:iron transport multicopper oxidase
MRLSNALVLIAACIPNVLAVTHTINFDLVNTKLAPDGFERE